MPALLACGLVAAACSTFGDSSDPGVEVEAGGPDGATVGDAALDTLVVPETDAPDMPPCSVSVPAKMPFASPGGAISNLTSDTTHVYWVLDGTTIQRKGQTAGAVESLHKSATPVSAIAAFPSYVVFSGVGSYGVANTPDAGAPKYMGAVGGPLAVAGAAAWTYGGTTVFRSMPTNFFGGVVDHPGVSAMAGNASALFYIAPVLDGGNGTGVFKVDNVMTGQVATRAFYSPTRSPSQLAADNTELFMLDTDSQEVFKAPQSGGAEVVLDSAQPGLGAVAVKSKLVYYSTTNGIRRVDASGTGCKVRMSTDAVVGFTVTDLHVYFVVGSDIVRVLR